MKKRATAAILAACMTASMVAGCSAPEPEETKAAETTVAAAEETTTAGSEAASEAETKAAEDYKIGLLIPGNLGDKSFFDASFRSIEPIEALGATVEYVEVGTDTSKYYPAFVDMCEKGYDLILTISSNCDDALVQAAEEYPD